MFKNQTIVIVGPTASGKTGLAISLAKKFGGEIICADSRSIYKGMDIGTAKPNEQERAVVPHWGLDLVEPGEYFSASDFKAYAVTKIKEIRARGKIPFLVGGTGLYIDSVIFDYKFGIQRDEKLRKELQQLSVEELQEYCKTNNIELPENDKNKRYIIRSIENRTITPSKTSVPSDEFIIVGITTPKEVLMARITQRTDMLFESGVIEETETLVKKYGWNSEAMTSNIYQIVRKYAPNEEEMKSKFITLDWRLAKRQMTWFKRNKFIKWYSLNEAEEYLSACLAQNE